MNATIEAFPEEMSFADRAAKLDAVMRDRMKFLSTKDSRTLDEQREFEQLQILLAPAAEPPISLRHDCPYRIPLEQSDGPSVQPTVSPTPAFDGFHPDDAFQADAKQLNPKPETGQKEDESARTDEAQREDDAKKSEKEKEREKKHAVFVKTALAERRKEIMKKFFAKEHAEFESADARTAALIARNNNSDLLPTGPQFKRIESGEEFPCTKELEIATKYFRPEVVHRDALWANEHLVWYLPTGRPPIHATPEYLTQIAGNWKLALANLKFPDDRNRDEWSGPVVWLAEKLAALLLEPAYMHSYTGELVGMMETMALVRSAWHAAVCLHNGLVVKARLLRRYRRATVEGNAEEMLKAADEREARDVAKAKEAEARLKAEAKEREAAKADTGAGDSKTAEHESDADATIPALEAAIARLSTEDEAKEKLKPRNGRRVYVFDSATGKTKLKGLVDTSAITQADFDIMDPKAHPDECCFLEYLLRAACDPAKEFEITWVDLKPVVTKATLLKNQFATDATEMLFSFEINEAMSDAKDFLKNGPRTVYIERLRQELQKKAVVFGVDDKRIFVSGHYRRDRITSSRCADVLQIEISFTVLTEAGLQTALQHDWIATRTDTENPKQDVEIREDEFEDW